MDIQITYKNGRTEIHKDVVGHVYDTTAKEVKISLYSIRMPWQPRPDIIIHEGDLKELIYTFPVE